MKTFRNPLLNSLFAALELSMAHAAPKGGGGAASKDAPLKGKAGEGAVVVKDDKAGAVAVAAAINFEDDAGKGVEGVDTESQAIPFLAVLQPLSPAVADELVAGAKPGMIMNTVTNELFSEIVVVPVSFQRRMVQWAPRKKGGGFKGEHMPIAVESGELGYKAVGGGSYFIVGEDGKELSYLEARDAHDMLKDTRSHFVIAVKPDGTFFPALMPLSSTQIKKSKKWISMILGVQMKRGDGSLYNPASFSHSYRIGTVKESNDQGSWFGVTVDANGPVTDLNVYKAAKDLHEQVASGQVKVSAMDKNVGAGDEGDANDSAKF
jgi:hypothetical protein